MKRILLITVTIVLVACSSEKDTPVGYLYPDENGVTIPEKYHLALPIEAWGEAQGNKFKLDEQSRIFKQIKAEGIQYKVVTYRENEFIVWSEKDDICMQEILINDSCK